MIDVFGSGLCVREATTSMKIFVRLVNARIASVLICLLWLLPSVVNEEVLVSPFACVSAFFTLLFVNKHSLEGGPCECGALSTGRSSETEPYLNSSTSSL